MRAAQALYRKAGFTEIPPYGDGLRPGQARYFELAL
jgi:ribosomal protein S18 acetylase RimI-like enzyme